MEYFDSQMKNLIFNTQMVASFIETSFDLIKNVSNKIESGCYKTNKLNDINFPSLIKKSFFFCFKIKLKVNSVADL